MAKHTFEYTQNKLTRIRQKREALSDLPTTHLPVVGRSAAPVSGSSRRKDPHFQDEVRSYANWLRKEAQHDRQHDRKQEIDEYVREATRTERAGNTKIAVFAPFHARLSALQTLTGGQLLGLCLIGLLWLAGLWVFQLRMVAGVVAAVTIMYAFCLILDLVLVVRGFHEPAEEHISDELVHALRSAEWPRYTVLCPLYHEAQVVPQFLQAMQALDYPPEKLQILLLTEEDDQETRVAIEAQTLPPFFHLVVVPAGQPRTKPRACNYGLLFARGDYVVIYDAEDIPDPLQLKKAVLTFANHGTQVACVQAKLNFYNTRQNLLTRWFTAEYANWFELILPAMQKARFALPLGGTSNHFRVDLLRALGAWDAYNVTEDCDLGLRLKRYDLETVILDSTTLEEANSRLPNWLRQRSRWIKGYMQTYLVHMRSPWKYWRKGGMYELLSFQVVIGSGIGVIFLNPLMWFLLALYLFAGSQVIDLYHILFPRPVLYLGTFCLIFGNSFYLYLYLLACTKKKQYALLPWTLFIPFYWVLMSLAAVYALVELLAKPHYWQKTTHGFHLSQKQTTPGIRTAGPVLNEPALLPAGVAGQVEESGPVPSISTSLKTISTQMMPALSPQQQKARTVARQVKVRDLWQVATVMLASVSSIVACWYFFQHHEITLYADALSHMRIARSVFDSVTPGLAQLGSVWLPLPHILMWPFIWNDELWRTGLAGSFAAMFCYVIAALFIFRSARKLTHNSATAFIGSLVFILNPNVLYLQATPLSEVVCMATLAMSCYFFFCWIEDGTTRSLFLTAVCVFLATLARYDGWPVFVAILVLIVIRGIMKRYRLSRLVGNLLLFGLPGGLGITLWLVWNQLIFGNPLYFQKGPYSSQAQQMLQLQANHLYTYHNLWEAIRYYTLDTVQSAGLLLCSLAVVGLLWFLFSHRRKAEMLGVLVLLVPFAFYILALYTGQAIIWLPAAVPAGAHLPLYNVRYGAQMVVAVAVLVALLAAKIHIPSRVVLARASRFMLVGVIVLQSTLIFSQGIIALQDGQDNYSCYVHQEVANYLAQHYQGGYILQDVVTTGAETDPTLIRTDFKNIIYEGSGQFWTQALEYPGSLVNWVIVNLSNNQDLVAQHIDVHSQRFLAEFTLVAQQSNGIQLYHRNGQPLLPLHPGLTIWQVPHHACSP